VTGKRRRPILVDAEVKPDHTPVTPDDKVTQVLTLIDELDSVALCMVLRHTEDALRPRAKKSLTSEPLWYHQVSTLLSWSGVPCLPFSALRTTNAVATIWRSGCLACQSYLDQLGVGTPADASRGRELLLKCVFSWMQKCNIPITFKTFAQQMANVSTAMESSFPGYRASGLLRVLLSRKE